MASILPMGRDVLCALRRTFSHTSSLLQSSLRFLKSVSGALCSFAVSVPSSPACAWFTMNAPDPTRGWVQAGRTRSSGTPSRRHTKAAVDWSVVGGRRGGGKVRRSVAAAASGGVSRAICRKLDSLLDRFLQAEELAGLLRMMPSCSKLSTAHHAYLAGRRRRARRHSRCRVLNGKFTNILLSFVLPALPRSVPELVFSPAPCQPPLDRQDGLRLEDDRQTNGRLGQPRGPCRDLAARS